MCRRTLALLALLAVLAVPMTCHPAGADIQVHHLTAGGSYGLANLAIDSGNCVHVAYVSQEAPYDWGGGLGYAIVDSSAAVVYQNDLILSSPPNGSGQAFVLPADSGAVVLFHHQLTSNQEFFDFLRVDPLGAISADQQISPPPGCTNTDSWANGITYSDGTYGFAFASCKGTGTNQTERNDLYYSRWTSHGARIGSEHLVVASTYVAQGTIALAPAGGLGVHLLYLDRRLGRDVIFYQQLDLDGNTTVAEKAVVDSAATVGGTTIDADVDSHGHVHLFWSDNRSGPFEIYTKVLDAAGVPLTQDIQLTHAHGGATNPRVVVDRADDVHLMWTDSRGGFAGQYYLSTALDGGVLVADTLVSEPGVDTRWGSIDVDGHGVVHAVWTADTTTSYGNVVYARIDLVAPLMAVRQPNLNSALGVWPNPAQTKVTIAFTAVGGEPVELEVRDIAGRLVRRLSGVKGVGSERRVGWDMRGEDGTRLRPGVYFVTVRQGTRIEAKRLVLIR